LWRIQWRHLVNEDHSNLTLVEDTKKLQKQIHIKTSAARPTRHTGVHSPGGGLLPRDLHFWKTLVELTLSSN